MEKINKVQAIKRFFDTPERPVSRNELMALSADERLELGTLCAAALGCELGE